VNEEKAKDMEILLNFVVQKVVMTRLTGSGSKLYTGHNNNNLKTEKLTPRCVQTALSTTAGK